jgi:hypothetical protein
VLSCCAAGKRRCRVQQPIASADGRDCGPPRNTRCADAEQRAGALARIPTRVAAAVESDGTHASHAAHKWWKQRSQRNFFADPSALSFLRKRRVCAQTTKRARARACDAAQAHLPDRSTRCVRLSAALGHCTSVSEIAAAHRPGLGRARLLFGCGPLHTLSVRGAACNAEIVQRTTRATQTSCNICTTCNGQRATQTLCNICTTCNGRHEMHTMLGTTRHGQQEMHTTRRTAIGAGTARCSAAHHRAVRVQF